MKEIGGYFELDRQTGRMLHEEMIALNCGRNALAYLIRARKIRRLWLPKFLCGCVRDVCLREEIELVYYSVGENFQPKDANPVGNDWLYIVNYYGQLSNEQLRELTEHYPRVIIDNAQSYFQEPLSGVDTLYTCRKYFGVADGAFLSTDALLEEPIGRDESFSRMGFVLGRFERTASEFYAESAANNDSFDNEPILKMSALTENLLRGINYDEVKRRRTENFLTLHCAFEQMNSFELSIPTGPFMYPLFIENGGEIRRKLQTKKIYIPTLWPDVFDCCSENSLEYRWARDILPLPCDQRYDKQDMDRVITEVNRLGGF